MSPTPLVVRLPPLLGSRGRQADWMAMHLFMDNASRSHDAFDDAVSSDVRAP